MLHLAADVSRIDGRGGRLCDQQGLGMGPDCERRMKYTYRVLVDGRARGACTTSRLYRSTPRFALASHARPPHNAARSNCREPAHPTRLRCLGLRCTLPGLWFSMPVNSIEYASS